MTTHYLLAAALTFAPAAHLATAQVALIDVHADIGVAWHDGAPELHWHVDDEFVGEIEYHPDEAYGLILADHFAPRPAGAQWDFLGTPAGQPVWFAPQSQQPGKLYLGLSAEEVPSGVFDNNSIALRLVGFDGPGEFSLWQTDFFGSPVPFWTTANGLDATDVFLLTAGSHHHFNWGFTALGIYTLTVEASGTIGGVPIAVTDQFQFGVGTIIPEPSTYALLLGLATVAVLAWRRHRRG